jgi:hypothetical protein
MILLLKGGIVFNHNYVPKLIISSLYFTTLLLVTSIATQSIQAKNIKNNGKDSSAVEHVIDFPTPPYEDN